MITAHARRLVGAVILVAMWVSSSYSANSFGLRDSFSPPATRSPSLSPAQPGGDESPSAAPAAPRPAGPRSQPYWQPVIAPDGAGPSTTETFDIADYALQWRVTWRCEEGAFTLAPTRPSGEALRRELADGETCPNSGEGYSVQTGPFALGVETSGPWALEVEQQVDVPLIEPLTAAMAAPEATVVAEGSFYDVDREGTGTVRIYQLADGSRVLRLDDFFVSINSDLEIRLSELARPTSTPEVAGAPFVDLVFLEATTGSMNYAIPDDLDLSRFNSVVIWCEITANAYSAASLAPPAG